MTELLSTAICLMGPTASGKTELAVRLVEALPCDIISVDSALVYRDMNIGTAKPDAALLRRAPHRLIDFLDPAESYSAAQFRADAVREMAAITRAGRIPLLVGGTMLYFRALFRGLSALPSADAAVRAELEATAAARGWPALHAELAAVDPVTAARLHPHDAQRIQRALEVYRLTGQPLSALQTGGGAALPYRWLKLALAPAERAELHRRIGVRFDAMLAAGLLDEVRRLYGRGDLTPAHPAMRAVGYRQLWQHLAGELDLATASQRAVAATRQYAKRQLTWLRSEAGVWWLDSQQPDAQMLALEHLRRALSNPQAVWPPVV